MQKFLLCSLAVLTSSVADAESISLEEGEALQLLQTSSAKVSLHSDKECKAAMKAHREAKKNVKTGRAAAKAARAAWKSASQTFVEYKQAEKAAQAEIEDACPVPEVDNSPDVGCSSTVVTSSYIMSTRRGQSVIDLVKMGLPTPSWYGFKDVVLGGGIPEGVGEPMGAKLGVGVMQPCSVAWTAGRFYAPVGGINPMTGVIGGEFAGTLIYKEKKNPGNFKTACECREWAESQIKWPQAAAVQFTGQMSGSTAPTECRVYAMTTIPWDRRGFQLTLAHSWNNVFTCYLGNPEEWTQRVKKEKAAGHLIDKCSKTSLWAFGKVTQSVNGSGWVPFHSVGTLQPPDPVPGSVEARKMCLKWVKADARCANALYANLHKDGKCYCSDAFGAFDQGLQPREPQPTTAEQPSNQMQYEVCHLKG